MVGARLLNHVLSKKIKRTDRVARFATCDPDARQTSRMRSRHAGGGQVGKRL